MKSGVPKDQIAENLVDFVHLALDAPADRMVENTVSICQGSLTVCRLSALGGLKFRFQERFVTKVGRCNKDMIS